MKAMLKIVVAAGFFLLSQTDSVVSATFETEDVEVRTTTEGVVLAGTLTIPPGDAPHPAVVLIWGNGPHTRDQEISGSPMFAQLAEHFAQTGIASLRVDKRGFGQSTGATGPSETNTTTAELADDVRDCISFLASRGDIESDRIGLVGHSEGAMIASMLASQNPDISWIILLGAPAARCDEIFLGQQALNMQRLGMDTLVAAAVTEQWRRYVSYLKSGSTSDSIYYDIGTDFLAAHGLGEDQISHDLVDQVIDGYRNDWHRVFLGFDPGQYLKRVSSPTLAVYAGEDDQVTHQQNLGPMVAAMRDADNPHNMAVVLPNHDHFFLQHKGRRVDQHVFGEMEISTQLLGLISSWLNRLEQY